MRVMFDVSQPVRRVKVVKLPSSEVTSVLYDFERLQKCCYTCQRLTPEQEKCPIFIRKSLGVYDDETRKAMAVNEAKAKETILKKNDPLFGVLREEQVGINPQTGRPRINPEVFEGMRLYLLVVNGPERIIREERVKSSISELVKDSMGQKTILRLEPKPLVSSDLDKWKGIMFSYSEKEARNHGVEQKCSGEKLLKDAIRSGIANYKLSISESCQSEGKLVIAESGSPFLSDYSTGYRIGFS